MSDYVQAKTFGNYVQDESNKYVLSYFISIAGRTYGCYLPYPFTLWCFPDTLKLAAGEPVSISMHINMPYDVPLPTVSFYMIVENTGQVILIDLLTPAAGYYSPDRGYFYIQGEQIKPDFTFIRDPLAMMVHPYTTFTLDPFMKDVNGNPVYVHGPVSFYATITTPGGVFTTKRIVGYKVYMSTRMVNLQASPNPARPGQSVTISGQLQKLASNGQWVGVPGKRVYICRFVQSGQLPEQEHVEYEAYVVTDSNGNFSATITAPSEPGTYTYYAIFDRDDDELLGGSWAKIDLTVVQPATPKPTQPTTTTTPRLSAGDLVILLGGVGLLTGITAYGLSKKGKT